MPKSKPLPSLSTLFSLYQYCPDTGVLTSKTTKRGITAVSNKGYLYVAIKHSHYSVHRIAWYMQTGSDPGSNEIDHIDRNRLNNRFDNLRLATHQLNQKNTKAKGWVKVGNRYRAIIVHNKKQIHLGYFDTMDQARATYLEARARFVESS